MDRLALLVPVVRREPKHATDRHQQKRAAGPPAHSRRLLGPAVDSLAFVLFVKDAEERRLCVANRTFADAFGVTKEWLLGKLDHDYFPQEQADSFVAIH